MKTFVPSVVLVAAMPFHAGGWASVTVEDLPDQIVVGQPVNLAYTVRQHGVELMPGLNGRITARLGGTDLSANAKPSGKRGEYTATLTLPRVGQWTVTILSGFGPSRVTLLPISAIDAGGMLPKQLTNAERGLKLFVAKGCITCHTHEAAKASGNEMGTFAPELTFKRFEGDYLKRYLADPSIIARRSTNNVMPNLNLKPHEIAALAAFINGEK